MIDLAVKGKATAIAFISTREHGILYRHANSVQGEIDRIPQVMVAREDGERMARLLRNGVAVWADLVIPNKIGGPIKSWNVVGEIRGREKPDEFVVLGAHLDSWELGTGALDNGCNSALVIDALRAIKASRIEAAADDPVHSVFWRRRGDDRVARVCGGASQRTRQSGGSGRV